jgi:hypothetical protein
MSIRVAARGFALAVAIGCGVSTAQAQIATNYVTGNFTYQFADPVTGVPIAALNVPLGGTAKVAVYLIQTGGTPNLFSTFGSEGLGVRLVYNNPTGKVQVPNTGSTTAQQQATINASITPNPGFDLVFRNGSTTSPPSGAGANQTVDTSTNAQITEGLLTNPVVFPGAEDPLANSLRMLIGTFTLSGLTPGTEPVTALDPFLAGTQSISGPNPPTAIPDGAHGEILIDPLLAEKLASPLIPTLAVTVVVPEPSTLALGGLAAAGLAAWRRRRTRTAVAV